MPSREKQSQEPVCCGEAWGQRLGGVTRVGKGVLRAESWSLSQIRRAPISEGPPSLGCYNPVMEDTISYAALRFPVDETDTLRTGYQGPWEALPAPGEDLGGRAGVRPVLPYQT